MDIKERVVKEAIFIIKNKCTVRDMVGLFGVSKSTVHYDLSCRLKTINYRLFKKANKVLQKNLKVRHLRGGQATKIKYLNIKHQKNAIKKQSYFS